MCGFVGKFGYPDDRIIEAGKIIYHRGPDMSNFTKGNNWSVAFNRLSILDLSKEGMQPFEYDNVKVFMNGEIYNYIELKEKHVSEFRCKTGCDVEIVPFLYRKYGMNFLNYLNGMFSMVIIDEKMNKKFLVKDRYGKKPLYYYKSNKDLFFSSEIKALKFLTNPEVDLKNLHINLISNFIIPPLTPYKGVFNLLPGHYIDFSKNNFEEINWYAPKIKDRNINNENIKTTFEKLVDDSIKLRLRSDVPLGIFLSGGLDSNFLLKKLISKNKNILALICNISDKEKEKNAIDNILPQKICKDLGCKSKTINFDYSYLNKNLIKIINAHDELITSSGVLIFYALSEEAKRNNVKVIYSGAGGDEIAGGYYWQKKLNFVPNFLFRKNKFFWIEKIFYDFFHKKNKFLNKIFKLYQLFLRPENYHVGTHGSNLKLFLGNSFFIAEKKIQQIYEKFYKTAELVFTNRDNKKLLEYNNIFLTISTQNYIFDSMTMANSIENRSPLLDFKLFEFMSSIPKTKRNKNGLKSLYKEMISEHLPDYVINAKKSGPNLPIKFWFNIRPKLKNKVFEFIKKNNFILEKYLSPEFANNIINENITNYDKDFQITFKILCLIIWVKLNIDKSIPDEKISLEELIDI